METRLRPPVGSLSTEEPLSVGSIDNLVFRCSRPLADLEAESDVEILLEVSLMAFLQGVWPTYLSRPLLKDDRSSQTPWEDSEGPADGQKFHGYNYALEFPQ